MDILKKVRRGFRSKKSCSLDASSPQWTPSHSHVSRPPMLDLNRPKQQQLRPRNAASLGGAFVRRGGADAGNGGGSSVVDAVLSPTHSIIYTNVSAARNGNGGGSNIYGRDGCQAN